MERNKHQRAEPSTDGSEGFIAEQIESVKKEQTRLEYQRATQILQRLMNGDKALVIIDDNSNRDV